MVKMGVDPTADHVLDGRKIDNHAEPIQSIRFERDDGAAVMPMQMPALAVVLQTPLAEPKPSFALHLKQTAPLQAACGQRSQKRIPTPRWPLANASRKPEKT